jgi:hypothetical protein
MLSNICACYKVMDTVVGEKVCAHDVHYIKIKGMPAGKPEDLGLMELEDLVPFIKWKKKKLESFGSFPSQKSPLKFNTASISNLINFAAWILLLTRPLKL